MKFSSLPYATEGWEIVAQETHFANEHLAVVSEDVRTPNRPEVRKWTVVQRKAAVGIAALTPAGELLLIRQERIPIQAAIWEVPAGQIDEPDTKGLPAIEAVARRELREEAGYEVGPDGKWEPVGYFFSSPGLTDEHSYFFLARGVVPVAGGSAPDEAETILECRAFALPEVGRMIARNEIMDANTLSICAKLSALGMIDFHG
ncbi:MAG: NUDIX hydrolase [Chthoniobacterales bacterium]